MKVKKYIKDSSVDKDFLISGSPIESALIFEEGEKRLLVFSDFDYELSMAILKVYIDGKYEKVTEEF